MSAVSYDDFTGKKYRFREGIQKRILVSIFSQYFPLKFGGVKKLQKSMKEDINQGSRADVDACHLRQIFEETYPELADVILTECKTKSDIKTYIQEIDTKPEYLQYDYFFFVFLTYLSCSNNGSTVYKDERIHLDDGLCPMQEFYDEVKKVQSLAMKPKVFLVQADDINLLEEEMFPKGDDEQVKLMKIPQDSDRLVLMSDIPQRLANPDPETEIKHPSFLIQAFGKTLIENSNRPPATRLDLLSLTPLINGKVQSKIDELREKGNKRAKDMTVPFVSSTLTKYMKI